MRNIIYSVSHKLFNSPTSSLYQKIYVGNNKPTEKNVFFDNTGDNIADKNSSFCELTAIYWILKNDKTTNNIGISHYRRYFANSKTGYFFKQILTEKKLEKYLQKYDIIVPMPMFLSSKTTVLKQYKQAHHEKDLKKCRKIIAQKYPDYLSSYDHILNSHHYSQFNMLITSRKNFISYHQWLFNILFTLEKDTDISHYDNYNKRLYGFLSERLFNVWLDHQKFQGLRIKYLPVISIEEDISPLRKLYRLCRLAKMYIFNK